MRLKNKFSTTNVKKEHLLVRDGFLFEMQCVVGFEVRSYFIKRIYSAIAVNVGTQTQFTNTTISPGHFFPLADVTITKNP